MMRQRSETTLRVGLAIVVDALTATLSLFAVVLIRRSVVLPGTVSRLPVEKAPLDLTSVLLVIGCFLAGLAIGGFYDLRGSERHRPLLIPPLLISLALLSIGGIVLQRPLPRTVLFGLTLAEALLFPLGSVIRRLLFPPRPRQTVVIGEAEDLRRCLAGIERNSGPRYDIRGLVCDLPPEGLNDAVYLGSIAEPKVREAVQRAEEVILVGREGDSSLRLELLGLRGAPGFLLLHTESDALLTPPILSWISDKPVVEIAARSEFGFGWLAKRIFDLAGATILALLSLPLLVLSVLAIILDDGFPVLIRQERDGQRGRLFRMWKFRTMRADEEGPAVDDSLPSPQQKVTRVGYWLRRHRIDELPQLIHVLRGEMSLVGPRPELPRLTGTITREVKGFGLRLLVRPGIAGLAQVNGEYDSAPATKLRYDLTYICAWSPMLDLRILLRAIARGVAGRGQ